MEQQQIIPDFSIFLLFIQNPRSNLFIVPNDKKKIALIKPSADDVDDDDCEEEEGETHGSHEYEGTHLAQTADQQLECSRRWQCTLVRNTKKTAFSIQHFNGFIIIIIIHFEKVSFLPCEKITILLCVM